MPEPPPQPERIDLAGADDPRDVVHRAVACLAQGGVVALPTGTSYSLAACALRAEAVGRLGRIKGRDGEPRPMPLALRGPGEVLDWVPGASPLAARLARRSWPGAVTFVLEGGVGRGLAARLPDSVRRAIATGDRLGLRCPAHPVVRDILDLLPAPLVLTGARTGREGAPAAGPPERIGPIDMILDAGPIEPAGASTVVRVGESRWDVVRPGLVSAEELSRYAGTILLFVCTGNTCRSPMAEALCRARIAARLACEPGQVEERGYVVLSAGVGAVDGLSAAAHAQEVVAARGGCLRGHASRRLSPGLVAKADHIIAMTRDHLDALLAYFPEAADRVRLLHAGGGDIDDPIGGALATYRETADEIERSLDVLLDRLAIGRVSA